MSEAKHCDRCKRMTYRDEPPCPGVERPPTEFLRDALDLGAGLGLLVPALSARMMGAMMRAEADITDSEELIHVTALALTRLKIRGKCEPWMDEQWGTISREYHALYCPDEPCLSKRGGTHAD